MDKVFDDMLKLEGIRYVELDSRIRFGCAQCGGRCKNRRDIELNSKDAYRMAKHLRLSIKQFVNRYCDINIHDTSMVPVAYLKNKNGKCPFLTANSCTVNDVKPTLCAMAPIGKAVAIKKDEHGEVVVKGDTKYLLAPYNCQNGEGETYTVREWLEKANVDPDDEDFVSWRRVLAAMHVMLDSLKTPGPDYFFLKYRAKVFSLLYSNISTDMDFRSQFLLHVELLDEVYRRVLEANKLPESERFFQLQSLLMILTS